MTTAKKRLFSIEKVLERAFYREIDRLGGLAIKNTPFGHKNLPDRTVYMPGGKVYLAEFKDPGEELNPKQRIVVERFKKLGFVVFVIDSNDVLKRSLMIISNNIFL